jgi:hypothetical protein
VLVTVGTTYGRCPAELMSLYIIELAMPTQLEFHEVNFYLAMLHKHALLDYLPPNRFLLIRTNHPHNAATHLIILHANKPA